jgi:tripeptide aminopeptidase
MLSGVCPPHRGQSWSRSRLSERGLPTPNIFTGGHDFHSRHEWICVAADMGAAVATIVHLVQVWAEETTKGEKTP